MDGLITRNDPIVISDADPRTSEGSVYAMFN